MGSSEAGVREFARAIRAGYGARPSDPDQDDLAMGEHIVTLALIAAYRLREFERVRVSCELVAWEGYGHEDWADRAYMSVVRMPDSAAYGYRRGRRFRIGLFDAHFEFELGIGHGVVGHKILYAATTERPR